MIKTTVIAFLILIAAGSAFAHKYHTTLTRIDYNAEDQNIEISIRLFVHDVVPMLERRLGKRVDAGKTPQVDSELLKYVAENFVLRRTDGTDLKLNWVGKEFENDVLFVYLESPFAGDPASLKLQNTMFFDFFAEQTNFVIARFGDTKYDLAFKTGDKFKGFTELSEGKKTAG